MHYFTAIPLDQTCHILIGKDNNCLIFSHFFSSQSEMEKIVSEEKQYFPLLKEAPDQFSDVRELLEKYKTGMPLLNSHIKLKFSRGTDFQKKVWSTLMKIPHGSMLSYKELAIRSNFPNAARAVGQAMKKNYFVLFVPCHRVIRSNHHLGGFSSGLDVKIKLLTMEKRYLQ
jgi:O-6-methylguanine DNA methyltransferase